MSTVSLGVNDALCAQKKVREIREGKAAETKN